jgi:hypothetical protein
MADPVADRGTTVRGRVIMRPLHWAIIAAVLIVVFGLIFGVAGIFLTPILGAIAIVVLIIWLLLRRARGKPPVP